MTKFKKILKSKAGNGLPLAVAIAIALLLIFCGISEYLRLLFIAQGVRDAVQSAVIATVNDNYDDASWCAGGIFGRIPADGGGL